MASKHFHHPQRQNNRLRKTSDARAADRWSFLEVVDAPQWVDLSLEARSKGNNHFDSWFGEIHEHHTISLAGRNADMSLVSRCKSVTPLRKSKECSGRNKANMRHSKLSENEQSKILKDSMPAKRPSYCTSPCSTPEPEPGKPLKGRNICSDTSSVTNSSDASSAACKPCIKNAQMRQCEDFNGTPACNLAFYERSRSSSSSYKFSLLPTSSHSSESADSRHTTSRSSELGLGDDTEGQLLVDPKESQSGQQYGNLSCEEAVPNVLSQELSSAKEGIIKGSVRRKIRAGPDWHMAGKLDNITDCKKISNNRDLRLVRPQHAAKETPKGSFKSGKQILLDKRGLQAKVLPRRHLSVGKENIPILRTQTPSSSLQVKHKFSSLRAPLGHACLEATNATNTASQKTYGDCCFSPQSKKKQVAGQPAAMFEHSISFSNKSGCSFALQGKHAGVKPVSAFTSRAGDSSRECEKSLIALVVQHNQKIRQGYSKWLR